MNITVCMMVRNEEALLPLALKSTLGLADAVIVVDTGSTDGTVEVARKFGVTVIEGGDRRDKAGARNLGIDAAADGWIVILDADERISEPQAVRKYLQGDTDADAVYIQETFMDGDTPTLTFAQQRIWRKGTYRYQYRAHEVPLPTSGWGRIAYSDFRWEHRPPAGREWKREHMLMLLLMDVDERPNDPRPMYYLAREYLYLGAYQAAIDWSRRYLGGGPDGDSDKGEAWGIMASSFFNTARRKEGFECLYQAMSVQPTNRSWPCLIAEQYHADGKNLEAIGLLHQALEYPRPENGYINEHWYGAGIYDLLARCYWYAGRQEEGLPHARQAVALASDNALYRANLKWFEDYHANYQPAD